jgi:mycothiol synthase
MPERFDILPVEPNQLDEAMRFLAAGSRRSLSASRLARKFVSLAHQAHNHPTIAWALGDNRPLGVAMTLDRPGNSAVIYHCTATAAGVNPAATAAAIADVSQQALDRGLAFVQAVLSGTDDADAAMIRQAGFEHLADLETLRGDLPLPAGDPLPHESSLTFRPLSQTADGELEAVLAGTYEGSLDCPGLAGLRSAEDVLAGHRASHRFAPESWWIVDADTRPAGVCLVNDSTSGRSATVVYLGVIPEMRGRSIARSMVRHAASVAARSGHKSLRLGVDLRNAYARNAYLDEGLKPIRRSRVFIRRLPDALPRPLPE